MKILALELSSGRGSIACRDETRETFATEFANDRKHSGLFFENLERALSQTGKPDRIVVGLGPGSYAGTRIAIAAATGLQAATAASLEGFPSLIAMPTDEDEYAVIGDARRQSFFFAHIARRRCLAGPTLLNETELHARLTSLTIPIFSSETLPAFPAALTNYPSARILAEIAAARPANPAQTPLEPMYLREPHITQPRLISK